MIGNIAIKNNTGARGLRKIIENILTDIMFEHASSPKRKTVKITEDYINKFYDISKYDDKNQKVA